MASEVYGATRAVLDRSGQQVGWARFGKGGRYLGSTGMRRGDRGLLQNSIRTVGARQAARTAAAYRTNSGSSASRGGVTSFMGPSQNEYRQYARFSNGSSRISSRTARRR